MRVFMYHPQYAAVHPALVEDQEEYDRLKTQGWYTSREAMMQGTPDPAFSQAASTVDVAPLPVLLPVADDVDDMLREEEARESSPKKVAPKKEKKTQVQGKKKK